MSEHLMARDIYTLALHINAYLGTAGRIVPLPEILRDIARYQR